MIVFGNVTVSGLVGNLVNRAETQVNDRLPARTTPPTSLFLPMLLSNSEDQTRPKPIRSANPAKFPGDTPASLTEPETHNHRVFARLGRPKTLRPHLSAGRSASEKSRNPQTEAINNARAVRSGRYKSPPIFCQRTFTKILSPVDSRLKSAAGRAF